MSNRIHHTTRSSRPSGTTHRQLRREMVHLRRDIDLYEQLYSTWQQSRRLRERQAEVRFHVIEAQLARLTGSDTIEASRTCPESPSMSPQPVLFSIGAYRL